MIPETTVNPFSYLQHKADIEPQGTFLETNTQIFNNKSAAAAAKQIAYELRRLGVEAGQVVALELPEALTILFTEALFHEAAVSSVLPRGFAETTRLKSDDGQTAVLPIDWIFSTQQEPAGSAARFVAVDSRFLARVELNPTGIAARAYSSPDAVLRLIFSSGTTGRPKPIALTLAMVEFRAAAAADTWMQGAPFLSLLDTSTVSGFFTFFASTKGGSAVLVAGSPAEIVQLIIRKSVASLKASPAQVAALVTELEATKQTLQSLHTVYVAGSALPPNLASRLRQLTGCAVHNVYGSSEVGTITARYRDSDDPFDAGTLTPGSTLQIVDDNDAPVADGVTGHIRYRRPQMASGYVNDPVSSALSFRAGWFYPGDFGAIQPDNTLRLAGRRSELLNAGGVKLDPALLDLFAAEQPHVVDACSFAYETRLGLVQIGLALVVDDTLDLQQLLGRLSTEFGAAAPQFVVRVPSIPRNSMGKPLRRVLAEQHKEI